MKKKLTTLCLVAVTGSFVPVVLVGCATNGDQDTHKRSAGQYIDDKVLVQRVKSNLDDNDVYKFPDVKVNTYKGTVQLSGFVETQVQKTKAEEIARNTPGVYAVQNNITMKGETERVRGATDSNTSAPKSTTP